MKLVLFLVLASIPFCCYAGSGCKLLDDVIDNTIDFDLTVPQYMETLQNFIGDEMTKKAVEKFKQCFLDQSKETLANVKVMMEAIYNSKLCEAY
ncbi:secretoglobin family 2A member 2-like [Octodon degus]|uniref:Secretoglobin family 2A member 2-like n=1 Tax=Octodon degus TaxID=10160 RepID=A0A6P3FXC5_OCTDE|nr:secretoglobin family 2A member 2-like [Octodon degus]